MKLIKKYLNPSGPIYSTIALPEVEVRPGYPRMPKESDYMSDELLAEAFATPLEYLDAASLRYLLNLYHTDYGKFKQEWERLHPGSTAEGRQATKDLQALSTMMQHRNLTMDKWKVPMTMLIAGPAASPLMGASGALAEAYPLVAAGLKGAANLYFTKMAAEHMLSNNGIRKTLRMAYNNPGNILGDAKAWMPITNGNFSTEGGLFDPSANRGWLGSSLGDILDLAFVGNAASRVRQAGNAYAKNMSTLGIKQPLFPEGVNANQALESGKSLLPEEISSKHKIPRTGLEWPEGYEPVEGYTPVRYLTNPDGSIREVLLYGNGKYKLYNRDITGTARRSTKYLDLVSDEAIRQYNPTLFDTRPEFIKELQSVAKLMDENKIPRPIINSDFSYYPEIWEVVLNTKKGKQVFPYGGRVIGRGEHPGAGLIVDAPGYPEEGIFTGLQPTLTLPYMKNGVRIVEDGSSYRTTASFEDYAKVVGEQKAKRIMEIDKEIEKLTSDLDFYTDFSVSERVQKLNSERRTLLGQHPEFGGLDLFMVPYSNKNLGFLGNRTPKIKDMGLVDDNGVMRHNWSGPSYDPAHPESVTSTNGYGRQLDALLSDDFLSVLLHDMHDIGYGDEFITRKGYPFRSMFGSNFDLDNYGEWFSSRYRKGGKLRK